MNTITHTPEEIAKLMQAAADHFSLFIDNVIAADKATVYYTTINGELPPNIDALRAITKSIEDKAQALHLLLVSHA